MPNPAVLLAKAMLFLAVAVLLWLVAVQVATVHVTWIADGEISKMAVRGDDPIYRDEIDRRKKMALPVYGLSLLGGLLFVRFLQKSIRHYKIERSHPRRI